MCDAPPCTNYPELTLITTIKSLVFPLEYRRKLVTFRYFFQCQVTFLVTFFNDGGYFLTILKVTNHYEPCTNKTTGLFRASLDYFGGWFILLFSSYLLNLDIKEMITVVNMFTMFFTIEITINDIE